MLKRHTPFLTEWEIICALQPHERNEFGALLRRTVATDAFLQFWHYPDEQLERTDCWYKVIGTDADGNGVTTAVVDHFEKCLADDYETFMNETCFIAVFSNGEKFYLHSSDMTPWMKHVGNVSSPALMNWLPTTKADEELIHDRIYSYDEERDD